MCNEGESLVRGDRQGVVKEGRGEPRNSQVLESEGGLFNNQMLLKAIGFGDW